VAAAFAVVPEDSTVAAALAVAPALSASDADVDALGAALPGVAAVAIAPRAVAVATPDASQGGVSFSTLATGVLVVGAGAAAAAGAPVVAAAMGGSAVLGMSCKLIGRMFPRASATAAAPTAAPIAEPTGAANDDVLSAESSSDAEVASSSPSRRRDRALPG
jgi:hypothetical protein